MAKKVGTVAKLQQLFDYVSRFLYYAIAVEICWRYDYELRHVKMYKR